MSELGKISGHILRRLHDAGRRDAKDEYARGWGETVSEAIRIVENETGRKVEEVLESSSWEREGCKETEKPKIDPQITKDTPINALILVKGAESDEWQRAHFARMGEDGTVLAWEFGCTSFTASDSFSWKFAKMWEGDAEQAEESEYASKEHVAEDVLKRAGEAITARNERLTVDIPAQKMGTVQLAHNLTFAKGGEIWLQNYDGEMKLRDLIRKIGSNHGIELPEEDNEFDETMFDMQQYGPCEGMEGLLAFLNFVLIGYDDLRAELKRYEDMMRRCQQRCLMPKLWTAIRTEAVAE